MIAARTGGDEVEEKTRIGVRGAYGMSMSSLNACDAHVYTKSLSVIEVVVVIIIHGALSPRCRHCVPLRAALWEGVAFHVLISDQR